MIFLKRLQKEWHKSEQNPCYNDSIEIMVHTRRQDSGQGLLLDRGKRTGVKVKISFVNDGDLYEKAPTG